MSAKELTIEQKQAGIKSFLKEAFCCDGDVEHIFDTFTTDNYFELRDSKRGVFIVAIAESRRQGE